MSHLFAAAPSGLIAQAAIGLGAGLVAGLVYFLLLRGNVRLFTQGRAGAAVLTQAARFIVLALVMAALTRIGALALLMGLAGVVFARATIVRREGRAP